MRLPNVVGRLCASTAGEPASEAAQQRLVDRLLALESEMDDALEALEDEAREVVAAEVRRELADGGLPEGEQMEAAVDAELAAYAAGWEGRLEELEVSHPAHCVSHLYVLVRQPNLQSAQAGAGKGINRSGAWGLVSRSFSPPPSVQEHQVVLQELVEKAGVDLFAVYAQLERSGARSGAARTTAWSTAARLGQEQLPPEAAAALKAADTQLAEVNPAKVVNGELRTKHHGASGFRKQKEAAAAAGGEDGKAEAARLKKLYDAETPAEVAELTLEGEARGGPTHQHCTGHPPFQATC